MGASSLMIEVFCYVFLFLICIQLLLMFLFIYEPKFTKVPDPPSEYTDPNEFGKVVDKCLNLKEHK